MQTSITRLLSILNENNLANPKFINAGNILRFGSFKTLDMIIFIPERSNRPRQSESIHVTVIVWNVCHYNYTDGDIHVWVEFEQTMHTQLHLAC